MAQSWIFLSVLLILVISGCTKENAEPINVTVVQNVTPTPIITVLEPSTVYVDIRGSTFTPSELNVIRGTTVRWTNMDSAGHMVTGDGFISPLLKKGDKWNYTFNATGMFEYNCSQHPWMAHGFINVE